MKSVSNYVLNMQRSRIRRKRTRWVLGLLSAAVVIGVGWQLRLPGITLADELVCPLEEHTHQESCYAASTVLDCAWEAPVVHSHDGLCFDGEGSLICPLPELEVHEHDDSCWQPGEPVTVEEGHTHGDGCYETVTVPETLPLTETVPQETGETTEPQEPLTETVLICTREEREPVTEPGEPQLVCQKEEVILHTHDETCNGDGQCSMAQVEAHQHSESCFQPGQPQLICGQEAHTHQDTCYQKALVPETEPAETQPDETITDETEPEEGQTATYQAALGDGTVTAVAVTDGQLPEGASFVMTPISPVMTLALMPEAGDNPYQEAYSAVEAFLKQRDSELLDMLPLDMHFVDSQGNEIAPQGKTEVTLQFTEPVLQGDGSIFALHITENGAENVTRNVVRDENGVSAITLETDSFSTIAMTRAAGTNKVTVTAYNSFSWGWDAPSMIYHNSNGRTVGVGLPYWTAVRVEYENGRYVVKEIHSQENSSKADVYASGNGFVLVYHKDYAGVVNVSVGDVVHLDNDSWKTNDAVTHSANGRVVVTFLKEKNPKNNVLTPEDTISTNSIIHVDLFDFGSGSTGHSINTLYNSNGKYPGFQQSGGTTAITSITNIGSMNYGDIITDDPYKVDGAIITTVNPQGINVVKDSANSPISRYAQVMQKTLGADGYPALADGTSLGYLFGASYNGVNYSKHVNAGKGSVDHLFQYDAQTGMYFFNSREENAQYDPEANRFRVTDQILTPNFIMYPFGNFMPFNDMVHDAKQVSAFDRSYFEEMRMQAQTQYTLTGDARFNQLATVLGQYINLADNAGWGSNWTSRQALMNYFKNGSQLPDDGNGFFTDEFLENIYSLDYDVEKDFYFGMRMTMNLMQPKNGLTGPNNDQQMYFYFTGDDDVWVYLDGTLLLDLSGIHRHVGGAIDFKNGAVLYFALDTKNGGDVGSTIEQAYDIQFFEDIFVDANGNPDMSKLVKTTEKRVSNGSTVYRMKDYSTHEFQFYYMERGSGSSVCRMNFNFPMLRDNSIRVTKELTADDPTRLPVLGNPDFLFQILKADGSDGSYLIGPGVSYNILDEGGNRIGTGVTDENAVFRLKAGQTAEFEGIPENAGTYKVRELLNAEYFEQYGKITINGSLETTITGTNLIYGSETFVGVESPVQDVSNGSTVFDFENFVDFNKLGKLRIQKLLNALSEPEEGKSFRFQVTLDGQLLPAGTVYTVGGAERTVTEAGIITLAAGEEAEIPEILAGTAFTVQETVQSAEGYRVSYAGAEVDVTDIPYAYGMIQKETAVSVTVTNAEKGAELEIPLKKTLTNPDDREHTFQFALQQVVSPTDLTAVEGGTGMTAALTIAPQQTEPAVSAFRLIYLDKTTQPGSYYYRITEIPGTDAQMRYDPRVYVAEVTITKTEDQLTAAVTGWWEDGVPLADLTAAPEAAFENTILTELTIGKLISGIIGREVEFRFQVSLTRNGQSLTGSYPTRKGEEQGTLTLSPEGTGEITLKGGKTLTISGIPAGADWTVTEVDTYGYQVSYTIDDEQTARGDRASGILTWKGTQVVFHNKASYVLPQTGGAGTLPYLFGGLLLMAAPLKYETSRRKRGRRGGVR